jgi:phosphoserine phosphatase
VKKRITQGGLRTVRRHLLLGHLIVVASGSPQFIIDEIGHFLHAHEAVGTRAIIREGLSSEELVAPIVFKEGKRERVKAILARHGIDVSRSFLYSDSVADTPLFEEVGHPIVVNPKPAFRAEAVRRGWEVLEWRGRWKTTDEEAPPMTDEWLSWEA